MKRFFAIFIGVVMGLVVSLNATTHTAVDTSYTEVNNAYGLCSNGDTLAIPAGTSVWASTLEVNKAILIQGAGSGSTVLTGANTETFMIVRSLSTDLLTRITGIGFTRTAIAGTDGCVIFQGSGFTGSYVAQTQLRIDHCAFIKGKRVVYIQGNVYGVSDHNSFEDPDIAGMLAGDNNVSWTRPITAGTGNAFFFETNTITFTAGRVTEPNEAFYHQEGARSTIRYNVIDCASAGFTQWQPLDTHGNQNYYAGTSDFRGQPLIEFYNNTITGGAKNIYTWFKIRGGSILGFNNAFSSSNGSSNSHPFTLTEEEGYEGTFFSPFRTLWPAQDQVNNSFFFGNTINGSSNNTVETNTHASDTTFMVQDRDYFLAAPASSGGIETWSGRAGGSQTAPTASDTSTMSFAAGANAYYPYTAYVYPHPLVSGGSTGGSAISGKISILGKVIIR